MIHALRGKIVKKEREAIYLENSGIEWEIFVSSLAIDSFGRLGEETRVLTWLLHREDQMRLYGFPSEAERGFFLELIKVDGIGPRQAMKILSGMEFTELQACIQGENLAGLGRISGIGPKTAQKIVLSMRGILAPPGGEKPAAGLAAELSQALGDMGYDPKKAEKAVKTTLEELGAKGLSGEELESEAFRQALLLLSKGR